MFLRRMFLAAAGGAALALSLAALTVLLIPGDARAGPAREIVVTTLRPVVLADGECSIIEAILNANGDDQSGSRDCAPGQGQDRILLPTGTIDFSRPYDAINALPPITGTLVIQGDNTRFRRSDTAPSMRFLQVDAFGRLELNDLILEGGGGEGVDSGAIANRGVLVVRRSRLQDNVGASGGAIFAGDRGYYPDLGPIKTTIIHSRLVNNHAREGGGVMSKEGELLIEGSLLEGNHSRENGGAILASNVMTVTHSRIVGNQADEDGGGVAIRALAFTPNARVAITETYIGENRAAGSGGGIYVQSWGQTYKICTAGFDTHAQVALLRTEIMNNRSDWYGGGIAHSVSATTEGSGFSRLDIRQCNISGNEAALSGGGIANRVDGGPTCWDAGSAVGIMAIQDSLIAFNAAHEHGGGIFNYGGVSSEFTNDAEISLHNVTISDNKANIGGGASNETEIDNYYGSPTWPSAYLGLGHVTLSHNNAVTGSLLYLDSGVSISNTILAVPLGAAACAFGQDATIESQGYNIESGDSCGFLAAGDLQHTRAQLGPLQDNGGPTRTRALSPDSPAIDHIPAGTNGCTPHTSRDQRGALRASGPGHGGDACDVGAFEANSDPGFCLVDETPPTGDYVFPPAGMTVTPPLLLAAEGDDGPGFGLGVVRFTWAPVGGPWQRIPGCQFETITTGESQFDCVWDMAGVPDGPFTLGIELHDTAGNLTTHTRPLTKQSGPADTTPPQGDITSPPTNSTQRPPVLLSARAQDDVGVGMVRFTANWDGHWHRLAMDADPPYEFQWDMAGVPDGPVMVGVEIYDRAGNRAPVPPWRTSRFIKAEPPGWTPTPTPVILCTPQPTPTLTPTFTPSPRLWLPLMISSE